MNVALAPVIDALSPRHAGPVGWGVSRGSSQTVLLAPPALGPNSEVIIENFAFDLASLSIDVLIDFGTGLVARSVVEADCTI